MSRKPNVIFILADDMGYGDVSCYNPEGKISTPNIDRIAAEGLAFHDAHSTSAVCTPSRYSILTGRYCWRRLASGIVQVYGDDIIPKERMTVAELFRQNGYHTACVGKWHLGMTWQRSSSPGDREALSPSMARSENPFPDLSSPVLAGPTVNGFDEYFGVDVPNWPPYAYLEGKKLTAPLTGWMPKEGGYETVSIPGPCAENWNLEDILPAITRRACRVIRENTEKKQPFFLYFPLTSPHTPLAVAEPWKGTSGLQNLYADFVLETDAMVGKVLDCLDQCGAAQDTWVIFASDNGCARYIGCDQLESQGHFPSYHWRGYKSDAWDGGHRIPFVMRWPDCIAKGRIYEKFVSLGDFMATAAEILDVSLPDNAAEDSISFYPVLTGQGESARDVIIHHSLMGKFAVRKGKWKLILCAGSGGFLHASAVPSDAQAAEMGLPPYQLYDLEADPGEKNNILSEHKEKAQELLEILEAYIHRGRSTPGKEQKNDIPCVIDPLIDGTPVFDDC